jgi:membrane protein YdbS with pleckstrin-like domain
MNREAEGLERDSEALDGRSERTRSDEQGDRNRGGAGQARLAGAQGGDGDPVQPEAEKELWNGRTSWKHHLGLIILWLAAIVVVVGLVIWAARHIEWLTFARGFLLVTLVAFLSGLEVLVRRVLLRVIDHRYRLTTQRLFIERGILSRTVDQTELIRVDDVRLYKSFVDRLVGLGSVAVVSTDATDRETIIEGIVGPEEVAEAIRTRMRTMRRKSLFLEHL